MFLNLFLRFQMALTGLKEESGQALVEYGLIIALIAVACVIALTTLGTDVGNIFGKISTELEKVL